MPPALAEPVPALVRAHRGPGRRSCYFGVRKELRVRATLYGAFLLACAGRDLAALRHGRQAGQDPPRPRPAGRHPPRAAGHDRRRPQRDRRRRGAAPRAPRPRPRASPSRRPSASTRTPSPSRAWSRRGSRTCATSCATSSAPDWDVREPGEGSFLVKMTRRLRARRLRDRTVKEAIRTLERRVNQLGVAEPVIAEHGAAATRSWSSSRGHRRRAGQARHQARPPSSR